MRENGLYRTNVIKLMDDFIGAFVKTQEHQQEILNNIADELKEIKQKL